MKKTLILMSLALLFSACSFDKKTEEMPKEIKIGLIAPLSGEEAKYGHDAVNTVQMIFEKANSLNGGLSPNLVLVTEDSACESDTASRAAEKLIKTEHVPVILTAGKCSAETLGVGKIAQAKDVTVIAGLSSAPEIAALGDHVFQLYRDTDGVRTLATELTTMNAKNIALVSVDNAYGKVSAETLKKLFITEPVLEESIKPEEKDFA
jgi:ABC-type branched-subunit amino acid transport system substrate-binding protein